MGVFLIGILAQVFYDIVIPIFPFSKTFTGVVALSLFLRSFKEERNKIYHLSCKVMRFFSELQSS